MDEGLLPWEFCYVHSYIEVAPTNLIKQHPRVKLADSIYSKGVLPWVEKKSVIAHLFPSYSYLAVNRLCFDICHWNVSMDLILKSYY